MREYDVALKTLLRGPAENALRALTGISVERWLDIELPKVQNTRMDLLGEFAGGALIHLELQSGNDPEMPLRMAEYSLGVYRLFGRFSRQLLIYVGEPPLRMPSTLDGPCFSFSYELIDVRDLDGDRLLESRHVGDNVLAILMRLRDREGAIREIVRRISGLEGSQRELALAQLFILAGLRGVEQTVREEIRKMPILTDIMDHKVLGPKLRRSHAEGFREGVQEGELKLLRRQINDRFGGIPAWAEERLASRTASDLETLGVRLLHASSLEDLLS